MRDTAVHLEAGVLPAAPVRHWVCSLPSGLRTLLGHDRELCARIVSVFARSRMSHQPFHSPVSMY
jgi:hypothetical protein